MIKILFVFSIFLLTLSGCDKCCNKNLENSKLIVKTNSDAPQRVKDLSSLAIALEKYKQDHRQYPISSNSGRGFDGLNVNLKYGESREDWIPGLAPEYIERLPRDPRQDTNIFHSYLYISDGASYKLIAQRPSDCKEVKEKYPSLIDPKRDCYAYGYWTGRGISW